MAKNYYDPADLRKFGEITEWSEELGNKFFDYYGKVFEEGALSAREKSLIALAVAHVVKCPYCIDAYTKDGLQRGITKEEMMEAVHAGAAIESGATLVHGVQMMPISLWTSPQFLIQTGMPILMLYLIFLVILIRSEQFIIAHPQFIIFFTNLNKIKKIVQNIPELSA